MKHKQISGAIFCASILTLCGCSSGESDEKSAVSEPISEASSTNTGQYVPIDPSVFVSNADIMKWTADFDSEAVEAHAWTLWGGMTAMSGQMFPSAELAKSDGITQVELAKFSTWYDEVETFSAPSKTVDREVRRYHFPRQVSTTPGQAQSDFHSGDEVISFNKFTLEFKDYVDQNKLYYLKTLCDLNEALAKANTPLKDKFVPENFDSKALMLKPTYWIVKKDAPSAMPYWKGPGDAVNGTAYPDRPMSTTWEQIVVVNPTGETIPPNTPFTRNILSENGIEPRTFTDYEVVGLDRFYHVPLTSKDIQWIKDGKIFTIGGLKAADIEPGDFALLVGCHVTSVESTPWTWQTFWWSPNPMRTPPASANVQPPFDNYDMNTAYWELNQDGSHHVCFNPYLETPIITPVIRGNPIDKGLGRNSNCMTCHHAAAFPTLNRDPSFGNMLVGSYIGSGQIEPTDSIFRGRIQTKFMWSLLMSLQGITAPDGSDSLSKYPNCDFQYSANPIQ